MIQASHSLLAILACVLFSMGETLADDAVVAAFGSKTAQAMCADGGAWLDGFNLPRERCAQISLSVLGPCMTKVIEGREIPLKSEAELRKISENLYACMKDSFLAQYGGAK